MCRGLSTHQKTAVTVRSCWRPDTLCSPHGKVANYDNFCHVPTVFHNSRAVKTPPLFSAPSFLCSFAPRVTQISQQTGLNSCVCTFGGLGSVVSIAEMILITILMGTPRIQNTEESFISGVANDPQKGEKNGNECSAK